MKGDEEGTGASPSGTGLPELRSEPASSLGHAAGIPSAALEAAARLLHPMFVALERMSPQDLGLAMEAFHRASPTNCWWAIYALKWQLPPVIAQEADRRGLQPEEWVYAAQAMSAGTAETAEQAQGQSPASAVGDSRCAETPGGGTQ